MGSGSRPRSMRPMSVSSRFGSGSRARPVIAWLRRRARPGPGLEDATRRHAFDRFFTADGASGSGLGLAIAKELAERMDGGITLTSRPGRTVFSLDLPVSEE